MKKSIIYFSIITLFLFIFIIFYRGLDKSVSYEPESKIKNIPEFSAITFFQKQEINSKNIQDLIEELQGMGEQYSVLKGRDFVVYSAVDQNMVTDVKTSIEGATEIAFFPPMTGG